MRQGNGPSCCWMVLVLCSGLVCGCRMMVQAPALPVRHSLVRDQLSVHSDSVLPARDPLVGELVAQRQTVQETLGLPLADRPIHVYLFATPELFQTFMEEHFPEFPLRRAFFVESEGLLAVYAHRGERVAEDLRHEVSHGYLHLAVANLPLWLDEGLAEYFEVRPGARGLNDAHVRQLVANLQQRTWWPDLERLEAIGAVGDMTQRDYAEAWAWVHFLLETGDARRQLLRRYLMTLQQPGAAPFLSQYLNTFVAQPERELADHVASLSHSP